MASDHGSTSGTDSDWADHIKTYNAFLLILKISGAATAVTLIALYFILAR